jgi:hypothetical protein
MPGFFFVRSTRFATSDSLVRFLASAAHLDLPRQERFESRLNTYEFAPTAERCAISSFVPNVAHPKADDSTADTWQILPAAVDLCADR